MSYTKLNKEIEKYYKLNYYDTLAKVKENHKMYLNKYNEIRDIIVKKWIEEKRYKELISCAHGGWFTYEEFDKPLEDYFVKENLFLYFKFLCERDIRFRIQDMIVTLKHLQQYRSGQSKEERFEFIEKNKYFMIDELKPLLKLLDTYISQIKKMNQKEYLKIVENIREKVCNLSVKKSDLKYIKHKI